MTERIKNYGTFYTFYLSEHQNMTCRILHFIGTGLVFVLAFLAIYLDIPKLWIAVPAVGYGFAWVGHFFFEKNKPATFKYPLWSLFSDFKMFFQLLAGKISFDGKKDLL
ncbi:Mpo1-like protein [Namhaeicola litoreus]|uniref:Mpo1-like protein n=1 Tax=Namhaeicola litoreus TaxID=1052145 RepID=A0ABW3Y112_9FLAO